MSVKYEVTEHKVTVSNRECTIRNFKPVFANEEERTERKKKIEESLYEIFKPYMS